MTSRLVTNRLARAVRPALLKQLSDPIETDPWPFEFGLQLTRGPRTLKTAAVMMRLGRQGIVRRISVTAPLEPTPGGV